ncbi:imm11 family protein, partial [Campylobacter jejuni]|uniref:imm11 family protein n=1 Tax=Campylobacter jejuni TaxID=197 RepID=UPI003A835E79
EIDKDDGKIMTDLISNVYNWRIVSPKFINLMQDLIKDCVQYLDVEIKNQEINYYDCKIMHVTKSLEALDYEHSVYTYMGDNNEYLSITKAVLKKSKLDGSHIFRIKDDEIPVFVS